MTEITPGPAAFHLLSGAVGRLLAAVDGLDDPGVRAPSRLPGWTRAHVLSHLAAQAPALERLLAWARTGVRTEQYAGREARDAEIEAGARLPATELVARVRTSAAHWQRTVETLPDAAWDAVVVPFTGEVCTARRILVIRLRELTLHLVDLDVGHEVADIPPTARDIVLDDVLGHYARAAGVPSFIVRDADGVELARFGDGTRVVSGTRADLLAWCSGRGTGDALDAPDGLPALPPWI
ncbi:maleylpyruvate isomerase family mycothiol-dependent enzyme [Streptomyces sp. NPDC052693]|uniref:maleylpyruvate isomerase N-terminal domain-containing protein n=1 Tax=Streptomyces sp. NPDC052693 TaxID=3155814 RepID=UPI00342EA23C